MMHLSLETVSLASIFSEKQHMSQQLALVTVAPSGTDNVYAASAKTKLEGMLANVIPGSVKGAMHEKMAKPIGEK